jgi:hypothetical protein
VRCDTDSHARLSHEHRCTVSSVSVESLTPSDGVQFAPQLAVGARIECRSMTKMSSTAGSKRFRVCQIPKPTWYAVSGFTYSRGVDHAAMCSWPSQHSSLGPCLIGSKRHERDAEMISSVAAALEPFENALGCEAGGQRKVYDVFIDANFPDFVSHFSNTKLSLTSWYNPKTRMGIFDQNGPSALASLPAASQLHYALSS